MIGHLESSAERAISFCLPSATGSHAFGFASKFLSPWTKSWRARRSGRCDFVESKKKGEEGLFRPDFLFRAQPAQALARMASFAAQKAAADDLAEAVRNSFSSARISQSKLAMHAAELDPL